MSEFEGDLEAAGRLFKAAKKVTQKKKRCSKQAEKRPSNVQPIVAEMKAIGLGTSELDLAFRPLGSEQWLVAKNYEPFPLARELQWTAKLPLFQQARQSSIDAMMYVHAQTQALRCSFNAESAHIEQTLFQIRAGLILSNSPRIVQLVAYAQKVGKGRTIHRKIDDALRDAERRKDPGVMLSDLNIFRFTLAVFWTGFLFWLMSDDNIARFVHSNRLVPAKFACNPSSITKARQELRLVKSKRLLVKAVGPNFHWTFTPGYPPNS